MDHSLGLQLQEDLKPLPANTHPAFYPMEDSTDVSLKALMLLSDDCSFDHEEEINMSSYSMFNPIPPLNTACVHNIASDAASNATLRTEHDVPMHMGNQMQLTMEHTAPTPINEENFCQSPVKKRPREEPLDDESDKALKNDVRLFRSYQAGQGAKRFNDLCLYREKHGNCRVPHTYKENIPLSHWVKRQRYQYKLMMEGKTSAMTEERVNTLDEMGFAWDVQGAAWGERLDELKEFRSIYMHCFVTSNYTENPRLASWVKCQRRQYKLRMDGKASNMTPQRIRDLEAVGFVWLLRSTKKC
jgi:hypothetical protein